jgi:SAM-dependent methyltransferase
VGVKLLPKEALLTTGGVDHGDWNYRPVIGAIQRSRFALLLRLMGKERYRNLLEIGYGSGILMPELAGRCENLFGIDPHPYPKEVSELLQKYGVNANLYAAGAESIPLETESIDCAVAVSSLEFVEDLEKACGEISRVLRPTGAFAVITPGQSPLLDFGLWVLTGQSAKKDFGDRRISIVDTLLRHFRIEKEMCVPGFLNSVIMLYRGLYLRKL